MKDFLKNLKLNEDKINLFLGVVAMLLVGGLLISYVRSINKNEQGQTSSTSTTAMENSQGVTDLSEVKTDNLPVEYTIKAGDSLWKIAQTVYGSGYEWTDIYEANKETLSNPSVIAVGAKITIPKLVAEKDLTTHTVVHGDNLWNIAEKYCNDGFAWPAIAAENKLENPRVIHAGIVLRIRCK